MHHQRVPCEASTTAGLVTCAALNMLFIHTSFIVHFLYVDVFGGTLVLHIGVHTHHIFIVFFISCLLFVSAAAAVVVYSFFHVQAYRLFYPFFISFVSDFISPFFRCSF